MADSDLALTQSSMHDSEKEAAEAAIDALSNLRDDPRYEFVGYAIAHRWRTDKYELAIEYIDLFGQNPDEAA